MSNNNVTRLVPLRELPEETRLVVKCAADITPERIDWLWEQRLPLGKCVLVAGEGGLGKSMVLAWIAATVSRGKEWPCGEGQSQCGSVITLSAEDDAADTIVPRLTAADADCSKVHILEAVRKADDEGHRSFNLQLDLPELEKQIAELSDVLLVIIDPITSYLGKVDSHKNAEHSRRRGGQKHSRRGQAVFD
jgi:putative DNA primase/helicase